MNVIRLDEQELKLCLERGNQINDAAKLNNAIPPNFNGRRNAMNCGGRYAFAKLIGKTAPDLLVIWPHVMDVKTEANALVKGCHIRTISKRNAELRVQPSDEGFIVFCLNTDELPSEFEFIGWVKSWEIKQLKNAARMRQNSYTDLRWNYKVPQENVYQIETLISLLQQGDISAKPS